MAVEKKGILLELFVNKALLLKFINLKLINQNKRKI